MDPEQINSLLQTTGITTSSGGINWANIIANIIFGSIGFVVCMYGWKNKYPKPIFIGLILSLYMFFTTNTILIYGIGIALLLLLYYWRD